MFMMSNQDQKNGNSRLKHIYNSKEIQQIVTDTIDYYETKTEQYKEENAQLHARAEEIVKHEYENKIIQLTNMLNMSYGHFSSDKEKEAYKKFTEEHIHDRLTSKFNSGRAPYLIPTCNGIGTTLEVVCPICGEKKDITDIEVW